MLTERSRPHQEGFHSFEVGFGPLSLGPSWAQPVPCFHSFEVGFGQLSMYIYLLGIMRVFIPSR